ncbi:glycosyltransferase family 2 protein [Cetobacterium somerae]|uniref:glycosyltransferase family 2 protein n=1 Tax=Cetobacterium somerae TaxID=188913 RepID=UPI00211DE578|nr:glycosyltransferase family 2 protein [Cetobacterium somerae]MCQ9628121.1 glycosyltransferase family 2 protein [Cetobacterium somerae]
MKQNNVSDKKIDILLSTYNGENFLEEQLNSIVKQTYENWKIIIRDDGSTDKTVEIIKKYMKRYPKKIKVIENNGNLGAAKSFMSLINYSNSDYFMFCDQDDYWLEDKIEITLKKMLELEKKNKNKPILIHTDLKVVNQNLDEISSSLWSYQGVNPKIKNYRKLIVENNITGCTVMLNKNIKKYLKNYDIKKYIIMHDWFLGVLVAKLGVIDFVEKATILYRQHGKNDTGAKKNNILIKILSLKKINFKLEIIEKLKKQSETIFDILEEEAILSFSNIKEKKFLLRKIWVMKNGFMKHSFIKNIIYLILI